MDVKEQVKRRLSIQEVASLYVELKPAGKYMKALCPFHTEKTPSFYIRPDKETFACYGCNKFGDIFSLVQEAERLTFPEAMNFLIEKFNLPVERKDNRQSTVTEQYARLNEMALRFFKDNLVDSPESKKAREYLKQRGIHQDTVNTFSLGYAENKWDGLYNHLKKHSCDIDKAVELGLLIRNEEKGRVYDRFRGRIIFPIVSESGALVAFGGRTIFDDQNKYLNSPDTPLYKKSKHLYGFNSAKHAIRDSKQAILVEGYFDVVSLYQNGVPQAVASLGTALTEEQVYLLKRFSDDIFICYDSDKAGITAAVRGIEKMFEQNINPRVVATGEAKDPDDFIREKGLKAFHQLLTDATDGFRYLVHHITSKYDLKVPERKSQAVSSIMSFVEKIAEPILKEEYIHLVADFFDVDVAALKTKAKAASAGNAAAVPPKGRLTITPAERLFLQALLAMPPLIGGMGDVLSDKFLSVLASRNIIRLLMSHYNPGTREIGDFQSLVAQLNDAEKIEFLAIYESADSLKHDAEELDQVVEASLFKFIEMYNKEEFKRLDRRIKVAERENDITEVLRLMKEKNKYIKTKFNKHTGGSVETAER